MQEYGLKVSDSLFFPSTEKLCVSYTDTFVVVLCKKKEKELARKNSQWMPEEKSITDLIHSTGNTIALRKIALKHL
jgi:hypothetical protein